MCSLFEFYHYSFNFVHNDRHISDKSPADALSNFLATATLTPSDESRHLLSLVDELRDGNLSVRSEAESLRSSLAQSRAELSDAQRQVLQAKEARAERERALAARRAASSTRPSGIAPLLRQRANELEDASDACAQSYVESRVGGASELERWVREYTALRVAMHLARAAEETAK